MKVTLSTFLKTLGKNIFPGQHQDSQRSGWSNTTESTETSSKSNTIYTKTNHMSLKTYQWIKGDEAGKVVKSDGSTILEGNIEFMIFTDGSRCNANLMNDYIMEIVDENDLILLRDTAPEPMSRKVQSQPKQVETKVPEISKKDIENPVATLLNNSKKKKQQVALTIEITVPPADLMKIVSTSFDDGMKQIESFIENSIDESLQISIKKQIATQVIEEIFGSPIKTIKVKKNEKLQSTT
jgi:hypothetical protein